MSKMTGILLTFIFLWTMSRSQGVSEPGGARYCQMKKSSSPGIPALPDNSSYSIPHTFDVLKYILNVNLYTCYFSPFPKSFSASDIVQFRVDSTLSSIKLNAANASLIIDSVRMAGVSYTHTGDTLTILLDRTYNAGEVVAVKIYYRHKDVADGAFYADGGMVFTDCEPEGARRWFPCWDKPSDKALLELTANVPSSVKLASNGKLADSSFSADTLTYHWSSSQNLATYVIVMTSKINYQLDILYWHKPSNPSDSIPMRFYYNDGEDLTVAKTIIKPMTDWFSQNFCEHPFQKNGFATLNSQFPWGGMENQTITSLCPDCWEEWLIAHEFAHQWFGDLVTCDTWADIWLNEGFASWADCFWYERYGDYPVYKARINMYAASYLVSNPGWAISDPTWASATPGLNILFNWAITYEKGACVLHMLRYALGDPLFFASLQAYVNDTNLRFHSARIADFNNKVNAVTGENYDWFFTQWLLGPNHPQYANQFCIEDLGNGNWDLRFLAKQVQTDAGFFRMPLVVKIHFQDNTDSLVKVMNTNNYQEFTWTFSKQPTGFTFDPDNEIVLKLASLSEGVFYTKTWTGAVSDDWNASGNWLPSGVPVNESVRIPAGATRMPVIRNNGMSCGAMLIEDGATLLVSSGFKLTALGTVTRL